MTTIYFDGAAKVSMIWAVVPTLTTLATTAVIVKLWVLRRKKARLGPEDCTMMGSVAVSIACSVDLLLQVRRGFGKHLSQDVDPVDLKNLKLFMRDYMIAEILYSTTAGLIQTAFLIYYLHRFSKTISRYAVYAGLFVAVSTTTASVFGTIFQCKPVSSWWDSSVLGKCMNADVFFLTTAGLHIAANLVVFTIPMPSLFKTPCKVGDRLGDSAVYALGLVTILCSFMRLCRLGAADNDADPTYNNVTLSLWSIAEINLGITTFCLPSFAYFSSSLGSIRAPRQVRFTGDRERTAANPRLPSRDNSNSMRPTAGRRASNFDVESNMVMTMAPGPYGHNDNVSNYEAKVLGNAARNMNDSKDHVVMEEDGGGVGPGAILKTTNFTISREEARTSSMGSQSM